LNDLNKIHIALAPYKQVLLLLDNECLLKFKTQIVRQYMFLWKFIELSK